MAHGSLFNLSQWMRQLGFARQDAPTIAYGIQPVMLVGDASGLTSPLLPPRAWFGTVHTPTVAQLSTLSIRSRAPGGTWLRALGFGSANAGEWAWTVNRAPVALTGTTVLTPMNEAGDPIRSTVTVGSDVAPGIGTTNVGAVGRRGGPDTDIEGLRDVFILPGGELLVQNTTVTDDGVYTVHLEDVPVMIPEET